MKVHYQQQKHSSLLTREHHPLPPHEASCFTKRLSRSSKHKCLHHWLSILVLTRFLNCIGDCPPGKTVCREIEDVSESATHTRKSLVKGERFIRSVWMAEILWWTRMDASTGSPNDTAHPSNFWQSLAKIAVWCWHFLRKRPHRA